MSDFVVAQRERLARHIEALTTDFDGLSPSEWAERNRYLPPEASPLPGFYRFEVAPYVREILDCLSVESPIREVAVMKGAQVCLTAGVLENAIGYYIDHVKSAPMLLATADAEMAKQRLESYILPMLRFSGLEHLIRSSDENNARKTGKTDKKLEWEGGGFLLPFGAQNANKFRSVPIRILLRDEIDGWPDVVGKDGDPIKLSADRTAAYEGSRKILDISTPSVKGQSKIARRYELGDQRKYFVCCLGCGFPQILRWRHTNPDTGEIAGIVWETEKGNLVPDSVRYLCQNCGRAHFNEDKVRLLSPEHGAEWRPTAQASSPDRRSYHLSALYSPVGMQTWVACVRRWMDAWDTEANRPKDLGELQVFYNNVLGEVFELRGERVRFEAVSEHRRQEYRFGEIPNRWAAEHCGSAVLLLTCAVDVHKDNLAVAVFGWCRGRRTVLVDYWRFLGNTEQLDDRDTWGRLRTLLQDQEYIADDGKKYRVQVTLIDSGYRADDVYTFCAEYAGGVYPVKGRELPPKTAKFQEFSDFVTPMGGRACGITVDIYKDRWSAALRRPWDRQNLQPGTHFNAPVDTTDAQLKELTVEVKREKIEKTTGKKIGVEWHRPSGAANELWDLLIYNDAAHDMVAAKLCIDAMKLDRVNWQTFYDLCEAQKAFFTE